MWNDTETRCQWAMQTCWQFSELGVRQSHSVSRFLFSSLGVRVVLCLVVGGCHCLLLLLLLLLLYRLGHTELQVDHLPLLSGLASWLGLEDRGVGAAGSPHRHTHVLAVTSQGRADLGQDLLLGGALQQQQSVRRSVTSYHHITPS